MPRLRSLLIVLIVIVVLLGGGVVFQLVRSVPALSFTSTAASQVTVPGAPPTLPWPAMGEATVGVQGLGVLGSSGGDKPIPIASLTKLMTAYVVLADHALPTGQTGPPITMTDADVQAYVVGASQNQSVVRVVAGEQLSELQALEATLVGSANNMATALAVWDAGSTTAFLAKMNAAATALGMHATHYADVTGLDPGSVSNASDQVALATRLMTNPVFAAMVGEAQVQLPVAGIVYNYDYLVGHSGIVGIKTGSTTEAGGCFVFAARRAIAGHDMVVIGAVLGQHGPSILQAALTASQRLIDAAAGSVAPVTVGVPGSHVGTVKVPWGTPHSVAAAGATFLGWGGMTVTVTVRPGRLGRSLGDGQTVATVTYQSGTQSASVPARVVGAIPGPTISWRLKRR